jgi:signal transduction histidine kinase/flagellar motor switch protein FliG
MEYLLIAIFPTMFLLMAAALFVVAQVGGFAQFSRSNWDERRQRTLISESMARIALSRTQLSRRRRELETMASELRGTNEELARLNTMKTKFLSMAVHDVRTPLSSVKGFAQLLQKNIQGATEKKYLTYINNSADKIGLLMGELTDLALIEAGKLRIEKAPFDLAGFVGDLVPDLGILASNKRVSFSVVELPAGQILTADRYRLGRVLTNLIGNAIKFTPAGGRVELRARVAGPSIVFSVKDTGPGIHPAEIRKIFEQFYQSRFATDAKAAAAGWGLGLAISDQIVKGHAGALWVESAGLGKGATFYVKIPRAGTTAHRVRTTSVAAAVLALLFMTCAASRARTQTLPLDDKARYEKSLEEKAQGVLANLVGPNRSKVVVDAVLDFTRIEKFEIKEGTVTVASARNSPYLWSGDSQPEAQAELLPGVPLSDSPDPRAAARRDAGAPRAYERRNSYPNEFVKRLTVTVVLDKSVDVKTSDDIRALIAEILDVTPARGDMLAVVHTTFMPAWKSLWYEPATAAQVFKYGLLTLVSMLTLLVVSTGLMQLTGAMRDMAHAQQISMEMRGDDAGGLAQSELLEVDTASSVKPRSDAPALPPERAPVVFDVHPLQVEALADMLASEAPGNIALVATHLSGEVRQGLLTMLPRAVSDEVVASLGKVRYVEPEVILNLKEELERRLAGAVGGISELLRILESSDQQERSRMIRAISAKDPDLGLRLRERLFLIDDLIGLSADGWALLHARLSNEEWRAALAGAASPVRAAFLASLPETAREILTALMLRGGLDPESCRQAEEKLGRVVMSLQAEGRLKRGRKDHRQAVVPGTTDQGA